MTWWAAYQLGTIWLIVTTTSTPSFTHKRPFHDTVMTHNRQPCNGGERGEAPSTNVLPQSPLLLPTVEKQPLQPCLSTRQGPHLPRRNQEKQDFLQWGLLGCHTPETQPPRHRSSPQFSQQARSVQSHSGPAAHRPAAASGVLGSRTTAR
jgi:hypothetical protein